MSPGFVVFLVSAAISLGAVSTIDAGNPGLTVILSKKTFDYAGYQGMLRARAILLKTRIPDRLGRKGFVTYSVTGLRFTNVSAKSASVDFIPYQGIRYKLDGLGIELHGKLESQYRFIRTTADFNVTASGINVRLTVALAFNYTTKKLIAKAIRCTSFVPILKVQFHGGGNRIIKRMSAIISKNVRSVIKSQICSSSTIDCIDKGLQSEINKLSTTILFMENFSVNIKMLKPPIITRSIFRTDHKGEENHYQEARIPVLPTGPIPPFNDLPAQCIFCRIFEVLPSNKYMVILQISSYLLNTISYTAHENNMLHYTFNANNIPDEGLMDTTCTRGMCVGSMIPEIGNDYPNQQITASLTTLEMPLINIKNGYLYLDVPINVALHLQDNPRKPLLVAPVKIKMAVTASMYNETFYFKVSTLKITLGAPDRRVTKIRFNVSRFQRNVDIFIATDVLPMLNAKGAAGILLPQPHGTIRLTNGRFKFGLDSAIVAADMVHAGDFLNTDIPQHPLTMLLDVLGFPIYEIVKSLALIDISRESGMFGMSKYVYVTKSVEI